MNLSNKLKNEKTNNYEKVSYIIIDNVLFRIVIKCEKLNGRGS